jgi:hypothetical protein
MAKANSCERHRRGAGHQTITRPHHHQLNAVLTLPALFPFPFGQPRFCLFGFSLHLVQSPTLFTLIMQSSFFVLFYRYYLFGMSP